LRLGPSTSKTKGFVEKNQSFGTTCLPGKFISPKGTVMIKFILGILVGVQFSEEIIQYVYRPLLVKLNYQPPTR
jgi:hypothetical protein